jgi:hypothetical protein
LAGKGAERCRQRTVVGELVGCPSVVDEVEEDDVAMHGGEDAVHSSGSADLNFLREKSTETGKIFLSLEKQHETGKIWAPLKWGGWVKQGTRS